ncbi:MAG: hypothetical protein KAX49_10235 [Halanaerobiales bacterium]|nr:hypothetical protein [Halanaerobiales bacterium]
MEIKLTKDIFNKHLNTSYRIKIQENEIVELKLIKCDEKVLPGMEGFTLIFEGPADKVLDDNSYKFDHDKMESINIFISPYRQKDDRVFYDAQFTSIVDED